MVNIKNLKFNYPKCQVFSDLTLQLEKGKIYGLLGQNGVGKTTLLKIMTGLLKMQSGECNINGYAPFKREPDFLSDVYFLPEDFTGQDIEVKRYAANRGAFYPKYDAEKFETLLKEFEIDGSRKFTKMSLGQQKKAIIAFALSVNTKLLLMDEPSNGLDIPSKSQFRRVISGASNDENCIIISTHQVRDMENLIDPLIILDQSGVLLHEFIERISEKLTFKLSANGEGNNVIYSEAVVGGYAIVEENINNEVTKVNIEAVFNTVLQNREKIKNIFKA
jgi:ABC-2 type transport system ATP-binding protein